MINYLKPDVVGHYYYLIAALAVVLMLIFLKGRRKIFVIPAALMGIILLNPLFLSFWEDILQLKYYWRVLWIVPFIPLCAALPAMISERVKNAGIKGLIALVCAGVLALSGTYMYDQESSRFYIPAGNYAKLPQYVVDVANELLLQEEHPRVVAVPSISIYIRQYSSEIETLFGRDIYGYINEAGEDAKTVYQVFLDGNGNYQTVAEIMQKDHYDYLVLPLSRTSAWQQLEALGFQWVSWTAGYGIVRAPVTSEVKRNDFGQIIEAAYVDIDGNLTAGLEGYCRVAYTYDDQTGSVVVQRNFTVPGNEEDLPYEMEESYGDDGKVTKRCFRDIDGNPALCSEGYAEVCWNKDENETPYVAFFDGEGMQVSPEGINLTIGISSDWTDWMTPEPDKENVCFTIGQYILGEKAAGDKYSCQIEIEFSGVGGTEGQPFEFRTQGAADGRWDIGNIWNRMVDLYEVPADGVYQFSSVIEINEAIAQAGVFDIGFRCDNWASGKFRVKNIKIEKGEVSTDWTPGL